MASYRANFVRCPSALLLGDPMILGLKQAAATLNDADVPAKPVTTMTAV